MDHHDDDHHEGPPLQTPTVFDKLLTLNVVDLNGHRHVVKTLAGKNLAEALVEAGFPEVRPPPCTMRDPMLDPLLLRATQTYFFPNMGFYTQHMDDAHVFIPKEFWPKMPTFSDDSDEADAIKRMFRDIVQVCNV